MRDLYVQSRTEFDVTSFAATIAENTVLASSRHGRYGHTGRNDIHRTSSLKEVLPNSSLFLLLAVVARFLQSCVGCGTAWVIRHCTFVSLCWNGDLGDTPFEPLLNFLEPSQVFLLMCEGPGRTGRRGACPAFAFRTLPPESSNKLVFYDHSSRRCHEHDISAD